MEKAPLTESCDANERRVAVTSAVIISVTCLRLGVFTRFTGEHVKDQGRLGVKARFDRSKRQNDVPLRAGDLRVAQPYLNPAPLCFSVPLINVTADLQSELVVCSGLVTQSIFTFHPPTTPATPHTGFALLRIFEIAFCKRALSHQSTHLHRPSKARHSKIHHTSTTKSFPHQTRDLRAILQDGRRGDWHFLRHHLHHATAGTAVPTVQRWQRRTSNRALL